MNYKFSSGTLLQARKIEAPQALHHSRIISGADLPSKVFNISEYIMACGGQL